MKIYTFHRFIFFLGALFFCSQAVFAQTGSVSGKVIDKNTGEVLPGANVELFDSKGRLGATCDLEGKFTVKNVPEGIFTVKVMFVGYRTWQLQDVKVNNSRDTALEIALIESAFRGREMVVSASRRPERVIEAPAEVSILDAKEIEARPVLTPTEHLQGVQSVDVATTGISSSRIAVRGFNGAFSGRLLTLTDNRIANVPALRVNNLQFVPANNNDIDRMEIIEGPASALYGPNAAGGVLHIITKTPFESQGTIVSVGMGERNLKMGSFRHAGTLSDQIGYKLSMRYQEGEDWGYVDPGEPDSLVRGYQNGLVRTLNGPRVSNARNLNVGEFTADARLDFQPNEDLKTVVAAGFARASDIELTGIGSYQIQDWIVGYGQARLSYKDLFVQVFYNRNDAGDTFNLRNGNYSIDRSYIVVTQAQHGFSFLDDRQAFTYGVDMLVTRPNSEGTIYGRNEANTDLNQFGYYLQTDTRLSSKLRFVAAGRIDHQNTLDGVVFSPRAGLVFNPEDKNHNLRFTFNQAFEMPEVLVRHIDINILPSLGPLPFGIQLVGNPPLTGFSFRRDAKGGVGGLYMQSPFVSESAGGSSAIIPAEATQMWPVIVAIMQDEGLAEVPAPTPDQVGSELKTLSFATGAFELTPPENIEDMEPLKARKTTTYEIGYKGVMSDQLYVTANLYYEQNNNFTLNPVSSNIFYKESDLATYLAEHMSSDDANALAAGISGIPVGTVTPNEVDQSDLIVTFLSRKEKTLSYYGVEMGVRYYPNGYWTLSANHAYRSKNTFRSDQPNLPDVAFNAPKHRFGASIKYNHDKWGINGQLRTRVAGETFISADSIGSGDIPGYTVVDLSGGYKLPFDRRLELSFSIQNMLNNKHVEFFGTPEIGRLGIVRLQYSM